MNLHIIALLFVCMRNIVAKKICNDLVSVFLWIFLWKVYVSFQCYIRCSSYIPPVSMYLRPCRGSNLLRGEVWETPMPACFLTYYLLLE